MAASFMDSFSRFTRSPGFKFFLVGGLVLLLTIPLALIWLLVTERELSANAVKQQIAGVWGGHQEINGPYLIVPYTVKVITTQNDRQIEKIEERRAVFLPETFNAAAETKSEIRKRSIYEVTVYTAKLKLEGRFAAPDMRLVDADIETVRWQDAIVALGVSDVSGLKEAATLQVDGSRHLTFEPSIGVPNYYMEGINARLAGGGVSVQDQPLGAFSFETALTFSGSSTLNFAPAGRETRVEISSDWPHPSFIGAFLPEERDIAQNGFTASWRVPHLARSVPQAWNFVVSPNQPVNLNPLGNYSFGVNFYVPIDYYDLVNRAAKYGLMFLAVAFAAVFILELISGRRVHAVQYVFVGLAMILFYILLLSLAEHIGFTLAYVLASCATGGMLSLYVGKSLQSAAKGLIMLTVFLILYGLLYLILRLEDYALLAGALAGFIMLTVTMFVTLRVNWSGEKTALSGA